MQHYIGTKIIQAEVEEKDGEPGYKVIYPDGYESWSPKKVFEEAYQMTSRMNFGHAIEAMKMGMKVSRLGWNGKGMFCIYVPGSIGVTFSSGSPYAVALNEDTESAIDDQEILPHFDMYTINADGRRAFLPGWLASQSDMDANDWGIV